MELKQQYGAGFLSCTDGLMECILSRCREGKEGNESVHWLVKVESVSCRVPSSLELLIRGVVGVLAKLIHVLEEPR